MTARASSASVSSTRAPRVPPSSTALPAGAFSVARRLAFLASLASAVPAPTRAHAEPPHDAHPDPRSFKDRAPAAPWPGPGLGRFDDLGSPVVEQLGEI